MANKGFKRFTAYGSYSRTAPEARSVLTCLDPSLAVQSQEPQSNINNIVKAFGLTGKLPVLPNLPEYGDFTDAPTDYRDALNRIEAAEAAFMTVPATVRAKFDNDAAIFFDAVHKATKEQLAEWGLAPPSADTQVAIPPTA